MADVTWNANTLDSVSVGSNGTVTGTSSTGNWDSKAQSTDTLGDGDSLEIVNNNTSWFVGIGKDPFASTTSDEYNAIEYAWYLDGDTWDIRESGSHKYSSGSPYDADSTAKILRDGTGIKYYLDNVLVYTSLNATDSSDYYVHATFNGAGSVTCQIEAAEVMQKLRVMFYPTNNVQDISVMQKLRVMFYPTNNVQDISGTAVSTGFKWWFGMRGKKKYGRSKVIRLRW